MRICVDIQPAVGQVAGVGRYTQQLVRHLAPLCAPDELVLFYFDFQRRGAAGLPAAIQRPCRWLPGRAANRLWRTTHAPPFNWFAGPADVYHFTNFLIPPLSRGRAVVTIYDLSFLRHPEMGDDRNVRYLSAGIRHAAARADAVLTISAFSAGEITGLLGVDAARVHVIYPGISPDFARPADDAIARVRRELGLERPYLLSVGTLEPRKNVPFLVDVFEQLTDFDGDLVLAGAPGWKYAPILERIARSPRAARIRYLRHVGEGCLPALYAGASLYVQSSCYEGFGFPPVEAMACGTPVLSSTGGSLAEVVGDAGVVLPDYDAGNWAAEVRRLLGDGARRDRLVAAGRARAARYRWDEAARQTLAVYRMVGA